MDYNVGDEITYALWGGGLRTGIVTEKHGDVKNGQPGFDMVCADGGTYWGYDDQIVRVRVLGRI
jgi:hypothetical protein